MPTCPACAASVASEPAIRGRDRLIGTAGEHQVVICRACGTGLTIPIVSNEQLASFYPDSYGAHAVPVGIAPRALLALLTGFQVGKALRTHPLNVLNQRTPGRLLDVGGGRGVLAAALRRRGWDATVLEPSEGACEQSRASGVPAQRGTLSDARFEDGEFDAIVFQHSLEHAVDPGTDLATARRLMAAGGLLLLSLPNFGSWQRRRYGADWYHLELPRHRSHFTRRGLEILLETNSFEQSTISTSSSLDGLMMTLQYKRYGKRRFDRGAGRYLFAGAILAAAPLTAYIDRRHGEGDLLHAVARKPEGIG